ncbi:unnamed protein product, partial [Candida parapsilosis]
MLERGVLPPAPLH